MQQELSTRDLTSVTSMDRVVEDDSSSLSASSSTSSSQRNVNDEIALNGRPVPLALRRQPTIYPHGLNVNIQTMSTPVNEEYKRYTNYSRACTMRSDSTLRTAKSSEQNCHRKYRISMIGNPENLAELQVRRYKYPLTGNYYLDQQDQITKVPWVFAYYECAKRYCRWKYIRWPIIFLASVLLFFGLITYCIWLHDVSVTRQRYLQQRRFQFGLNDSNGTNEIRKSSEEQEATLGTVQKYNAITTSTTARSHILQESTLLRAIGTKDRPKEQTLQTLTTKDYDVSKTTVEWNKARDKPNPIKPISNPVEDTSNDEGPTDVDSVEEHDYVSLERIRFTSGHQNGFGVPFEENERILRIINGLNPLNQPLTTAITPQTRVSPTIPPVQHLSPTMPMNADTRQTVASPDNRCYSTSLTMCRGVLDYDLTYNSTTLIDQYEQAAYEELLNSNCSARTLEFVCALLEPECRPLHIGILPPCRRICKAILEACSVVIANSDILSGTFDCNLYPDSSDPHKCEDPTRRSDYCYDNEFECYDNTCIPHQWQCDNIKDCAAGEDEDECLQCDQDEFRCRSNDKCVPESVRCNLKYDCFDGSDEDDCEEYGSGDESAAAFDEAALNSFPRVFSYASYLSPNQTNEGGQFTYITATTDDETGTKFEIHELANRTSGISKEDVTNNVPGTEVGSKGFVNFRDSKEIMMTSDSENKFKYSAVRGNRTGSRYSTPATLRTIATLQPAASQIVARTTPKPLEKSATTCAPHQLRCVSGKCITVAQLCDKKIDCPDGADELMCVYKEVRSTTKRYNGTSNLKADIDAVTTDSTRIDRRTLRTTLKRKLKV